MIDEELNNPRIQGFEEGLGVIGILGGIHDVTWDHLHPHRGTLLKPTKEGHSNEEVEGGREGATLTNTRCPADRL